ncbi:hypothetical protein HZH68_003617 [Vespula germanica]|uniref:XPA C-terminal domain-containing protein n=1 Tax=Vespula germanica TaxID=30212 RepID=A0A834NPH5_VESGE|nr:hypothetical protein HZH68_003617 [Vespula germanica]
MSTEIINNKSNSIINEDVSSQMKEELNERAERNRQKALLLKNSKLVAHPYAKGENDESSKGRAIKVQGKRVVDSGGGFLIEENDELEQQMVKIVTEPAPFISLLPRCNDCNKEFKDSYLLQTFDLEVCDACRDSKDKHSLITKSEAKQEYLLRDYDFDKREPALKYIVRKNPHNPRWGEMKLYLHLQIEQRALEVWGSEEKLLEEKEKRDLKREETKIKHFNKKIKRLRMQVRSSLYNKTTKAVHVHEFGEETYNETDDTYSHTCLSCGYDETYEKM